MSKMSQAYVDSAPDRADSAECDLACCRHAMRDAANRVASLGVAVARSRGMGGEAAAELARGLAMIVADLRNTAGSE